MIKKFFEYNSDKKYEESDYLTYKSIKTDNFDILFKVYDLVRLKYNVSLYEKKKFSISFSLELGEKKRIINKVDLRCEDDYIYIDNYINGNSFYYKCDQLSGFKSFLHSDILTINYTNHINCQTARELFVRMMKKPSESLPYKFGQLIDMSGDNLYYIKHNNYIGEESTIYINPFVENYNSISVESEELDLFYTIDLDKDIPITEDKMRIFIKKYYNYYIPKIIEDLD